MPQSQLEATFALQLRTSGLPDPQREHRFHPKRRWRFDFAWPDVMLAVEVEGGTWSKGRHTRGRGFAADCEKYNEAALLGWRVLRFTGDMVDDWSALETVREALGKATPEPTCDRTCAVCDAYPCERQEGSDE